MTIELVQNDILHISCGGVDIRIRSGKDNWGADIYLIGGDDGIEITKLEDKPPYDARYKLTAKYVSGYDRT